jgi:hypothetical protein
VFAVEVVTAIEISIGSISSNEENAVASIASSCTPFVECSANF